MQQQPLSTAQRKDAEPKRKRGCLWIVFAFVIVVPALGVCGYVATGPYRTLAGLRAALAQNDANALAEYVDFPALRQNLKLQLLARANSGINSLLPSGIASQIAGGLASTLVDTTVDALITPSGLSQVVSGASIGLGQLPSASGASATDQLASAHGSFQSLSTFTATVTAASSDIVLELTRNGLGWQLTNVKLPAAEK